jgi:hypothetical protein
VLARGKQFHREVQAVYVAGLLGVTADTATEQTILHPSGSPAIQPPSLSPSLIRRRTAGFRERRGRSW